MLTDNQEKRVELTNEITEKLVDNAIAQITKKYDEGYHKQNPHLLSSFIELHKTIYLATQS